jgi:regulator of replication initiation timing
MDGLIKFENGKLAQQAVDYITAVETQMKVLKEQYDAFKDELLNAMEQNGFIKIESDNIRINYIAETTRETFDSKQFKADMPDLYNEYVKFSKVKPSIRIKVE